MVVCLERGANDLRVVWSSWFHCHQNGFTVLLPAYPGCPGKKAVKRMSVLVCLSVSRFLATFCETVCRMLSDRFPVLPVCL